MEEEKLEEKLEAEEEENKEKTTEEVLKETKEVLEALKQENKKREELIAREELLQAQSGMAEAGIMPEGPKEKTPEEYKKEVEEKIRNGEF